MKHLTPKQQLTLDTLEKELSLVLREDRTGHDFGHIQRVVSLSKALCSEKANMFVVIATAYLHELFDDKLLHLNFERLEDLEKSWSLDFDGHQSIIHDNIQAIGYKGGFTKHVTRSLEAQIVSDADLLDAMGAIGIARAFYYAGYKGLPFHDTALDGIVATNYETYRNGTRNAIAHFDEKLLRIYDALETDKAKQIGKIRHQRLVRFYHDFYEEMKGNDYEDIDYV